jgi:opacity protein-like surface antigen
MKKVTILLVLTIVALTVFAQEAKSIRGYQGILEVGGGFNVAESNATYLKADFINGYRINHSLSIGYGIGVRYAINDSWTIWENAPWVVLPLIGNFRANLGYSRLGNAYPYVQAGLGFSIPWGFVINHSFGIAFKP